MTTHLDIAGTAEAARILGVSTQWLDILAKRPGFPVPTRLACGPVWDAAELRAYAEERKR